MRLVSADLALFRNLQRQTVTFHPRYNLVVGRNGQGKTNLLEAIGYLGTLRSFRGAGRGDLIRFGEEECRVRGEVERGGVSRSLSFSLGRRGRSQAADEKKVPLADYLSVAPAVSFVPEDVGLVAGGPARRRRMLDRAVFEADPGYLGEYRRYHLALRHRNALLRGGRGSEAELSGWAETLAEAGAALLQKRARFLRDLAPHLAELGRELLLEEGLELSYLPSCPLPDGPPSALGALGALADALRAGIAASRARERAMRATAAGPHRDDLVFLHGGRDLGRCGSQGQKRAAVLALKLAQSHLMEGTRGGAPLVLLDDVASELDRWRREALGRVLGALPGQVFVSATGDDGPLLPPHRQAARLRVEAGRVTTDDEAG